MRHNLFVSTLTALLFNTAIAGLLTVIKFGEGFWVNFVFSQCIGLSIYGINATVACRIAGSRRWVLALTFPGSIVLGLTLASWLTGVGGWGDPDAWVSVVIGLFFGGIGSITHFLSARIEKLDAEVKQHQLIRSETEKRELEAQLKLLQAQIEPHFLFNTLANVGSLIETDPALAKKLLERLNDWLRVALARARSETATLGDELDMLENYLQILKVRFGERLRWQIDAGDAARNAPFPPMLLQPLVENAVRHGVEPKVGGGAVAIRAACADGRLCVEVSDSGAGLGEEPGAGLGVGAGLGNVRARLAALYGGDGRFALYGNDDGGATAVLEIPR